jgi:protein involved in ribonucleotide reduction
MDVVYFSNVSNNTHRFVERLGCTSHRIPLRSGEPDLVVEKPYILITPTYGGGKDGGAVPKQVIRFLNNAENRKLIRGVITSGNTNFGHTYGLAGKIISYKCNVPLLHTFELLGTNEDEAIVKTIIQKEHPR